MKTTTRIILASFLGIHAATAQASTTVRPSPIINPGGTPFSFANTRPICVVLVHGITGFPKPPDTSPAPTTPNPGTLKHARYYWQPEFVRGLMGLATEDPVSFTNAPEAEGDQMRPSNWETDVCDDTVASDHLMSATGRPNPSQGFYPFLSVMFTHRDGSKPLAVQSADTATQIETLYRESFESWPAAKQPQLILLCHSGGGLVARTICTAPRSLGGVATTIPNRIFSRTERDTMDYIRQRTMYIVTLSTPHEGAQVAQVANEVGQHLQFIPEIDAQDPDAPILAELRLPAMLAYNRNQLHPSLCKRPDNSRIPLYCLGGRAPGGPEYYADPNQYDSDADTPDGGIRFRKDQLDKVRTNRSNRREFEAYGLMKADFATQTIWAATHAAAALLDPSLAIAYGVRPADNPGLDIVRTVEVNNFGPLGHQMTSPILSAGKISGPRLFYLRNRWVPVTEKNLFGFDVPTGRFANLGRSTEGDGIIDCDGFVPINSALGAKLGTATTNAFAHTTPGGSWYRFYRSAADYHNHGSVTRSEEIGQWVRKNITGCHIGNQLFNFVRTDLAAGPRVSTTGTKSVW